MFRRDSLSKCQYIQPYVREEIKILTCSRNHKHYFLTNRFMFPLEIIALFFGVVSFFTGFLAMCIRVGGMISALLAALSLLFQIIVTALMT